MREWLKLVREQESLTQKTIADMVGIRQSHYSEIENNKANPHPNTAKAIAEVLNFDKHNVSWTKFYENKENSA